MTIELPSQRRKRKKRRVLLLNILIAVALVAGTWGGVKWYLEQKSPVSSVPSVPAVPPYAEVTVYGRGQTVNVTLPPPWNGVRGEVIDGGMVFRLPVKTQEDVDAIRRKLDAEPTLREKRGKPLTYDVVSFFDLVSDDLSDVKKTIGMFRAENFLVKIEGESNGVLRVSTVSPAGLMGRLKGVFSIQTIGKDRLSLKPIRKKESAATNAVMKTTTNAVVPAVATNAVLPAVATNAVLAAAKTNAVPPVRPRRARPIPPAATSAAISPAKTNAVSPVQIHSDGTVSPPWKY